MTEFRDQAMLDVAQGRTSLEELFRVIPPEYLDAAAHPRE